VAYEETEAGLRTLPHIKQAAVMRQGAIDQQLVAYIVFEPDCAINWAELHRSLSSGLPEVKVPDVYVVLDGLPLAADGELDRKALGRAVRGRRGSSHLTPQVLSGSVADVADIWREILGLESVGICDDLFDLGGHSLTITRIATRIRSRMGIEVPLTVFYDTPTILGIASAVERARRGGRLHRTTSSASAR
jgi:acyl carrier protein